MYVQRRRLVTRPQNNNKTKTSSSSSSWPCQSSHTQHQLQRLTLINAVNHFNLHSSLLPALHSPHQTLYSVIQIYNKVVKTFPDKTISRVCNTKATEWTLQQLILSGRQFMWGGYSCCVSSYQTRQNTIQMKHWIKRLNSAIWCNGTSSKQLVCSQSMKVELNPTR